MACNSGGGWQTQAAKKRKGTLSSRLLDLAVETGRSDIVSMARKAQRGELGEAEVAKAWKIVGGKSNDSNIQAKSKDKGKGRGNSGPAAGAKLKEVEKKLSAALKKADSCVINCRCTIQLPMPAGCTV